MGSIAVAGSHAGAAQRVVSSHTSGLGQATEPGPLGQFLDDGVESLAGGQLRGRPILRRAAVATLAGRTNDRVEAARLLSSSAPLLDGQPAAVVDAVAELLHRLYLGEAWLQGVQPDLLGEHLVERALLEDLDLLGAVFGDAQ